MTEVTGYVLELYRHGFERPCYVSSFDQEAEAGLDGYSETKEEAVVFECREALLPLASIEVESIEMDGIVERSVFDGFRILPFKGNTSAQFITTRELEAALEAFDE